MSSDLTYTESIFPLGQSGQLSTSQWVQWNSSAPITLSFVNGLPVASVWWAMSPGGPISFYLGPIVTGSPFYVTDGTVPEVVSIPSNATQVTITGPGTTFWIFASTVQYSPNRASTPPTLNVQVTAPLVNTGTSSAPILGLSVPLATQYGGTGQSSTPSLIAGNNITITGIWPDQTINAVLGAGGVQSVTVNAPLVETGTAQNPIISLNTPLAVANGGTAQSNPYLEGDPSGILVNGANNVQDQTFQWVVSLGAFLSDNAGSTIIGQGQLLQHGGITVTKTAAKQITFDTTALVPVTGGITSTGNTITVTPHSGSQSVNLETTVPGLPLYTPTGSGLSANPHIVRSSGGAYSITWNNNNLGSTTVTLTGNAQFTGGSSYAISFMITGVTGGATPPVFVLEANTLTAGGFNVTGYGTGGSGSGNINFDIICVGQ